MTSPKRNRRVPLACGIALALCVFDASAQQAADGTIETEPYQDRIIDPTALAQLPPDEFEDYDDSGLPRSWSIEAIVSESRYGDDRFGESGLVFDGLWETTRYGSLSLDAAFFNTSQPREGGSDNLGLLTLWQRGLAFDGGWLANNGFGVLDTDLPPLLATPYRFFLPAVPFDGLATDWQRGDDVQLMASYGRAGVFRGTRVVGFDRADGNVGAAAAQWRWNREWSSALALLSTDGRIVPDAPGTGTFEEGATDAFIAATGWDRETYGATAYAQGSRGEGGDANGGWIDAWSHFKRYKFNYGIFHLDPGLAWGATAISNDARGGYLHVRYQHARWSWNADIDSIRSISGESFDGQYGSFFARYQAGANLAYGGNFSFRDGDGGSDYATRAFVDHRTGLGQSRWQFDYADGAGADGDWELSLDQELPMRRGQRLSLAAGYGELAYDETGDAAATWSLSAYGGIEIGQRLTIDGNVRYAHASGDEAYRLTDVNLSLNWRLARHWWLSTTLYETSGRRRSPFVLDPLAPPDQFGDLPRSRSLYLSIRYERQAGSAQAIIGGGSASSAGSIAGSVFLDENDDGVRSASEQPAANVTVLLDGRFAVRTDSQGRFSFDRVSAGSHDLQVQADNLPLPWSFADGDERRPVQVQVRSEERVDIGARRQR
jgi:hypothetical protein